MMENETFNLPPVLADRLEAVAGYPGRSDLADKLKTVIQKSYRNEFTEAKRKGLAERAIILALSTVNEEINRWKFLQNSQNGRAMTARSIEVARSVVGSQLKDFFSLKQDWSVIYEPQQLKGPPIDEKEQERNRWRMAVLREWVANGKLLQKDETGAYRYSLEDCKAEAARRQEVKT